MLFSNLALSLALGLVASGLAARSIMFLKTVSIATLPFCEPVSPRSKSIQPTETKGAATAAANFLTNTGLFRGQSDAFFQALFALAAAADKAVRDLHDQD